ncbi:MAG TPA: sugar transferase [Acidimicrobiia bacterium]|nr:sugar transferase [Acidimicrobiia bacterium]
MSRPESVDVTGAGAPPRLRIAHSRASAERRSSGSWLRRVLQLLDLCSVMFAWTVTMLLGSGVTTSTLGKAASAVLAAGAAGLVAIAAQHLYLSRVSAVRAVELIRLSRAAIFSGVVAYFVADQVGLAITVPTAVVGSAIAFVMLACCRSLYDGWLKAARGAGRFARPVVIIGSNDEASELCRLLETHPEVGLRAVGVVGRQDQVQGWRVPWLGRVEEAVELVELAGANGVIVAASAMPSEQLNRITRDLLDRGKHVHLSSGLHGIASRRVRALPLANEPMFYLEPIELKRWQFAAKRLLDIVLASILLVLTFPVLVVAAIAIKLEDHGSVIFRQERVGRGGSRFKVLKLRTMRPDAEQLLPELLEQNERVEGPLFKLSTDPRRTRVGRLLEATSIDELPQLINVLRGEMSLVGPRPALAHEIEQFDEELLVRLSVPPGVTGLWQVEARDNPSFHAYRRLDLFYIENWSVALDLAVIFATFKSLIVRLLHGRG